MSQVINNVHFLFWASLISCRITFPLTLTKDMKQNDKSIAGFIFECRVLMHGEMESNWTLYTDFTSFLFHIWPSGFTQQNCFFKPILLGKLNCVGCAHVFKPNEYIWIWLIKNYAMVCCIGHFLKLGIYQIIGFEN